MEKVNDLVAILLLNEDDQFLMQKDQFWHIPQTELVRPGDEHAATLEQLVYDDTGYHVHPEDMLYIERAVLENEQFSQAVHVYIARLPLGKPHTEKLTAFANYHQALVTSQDVATHLALMRWKLWQPNV